MNSLFVTRAIHEGTKFEIVFENKFGFLRLHGFEIGTYEIFAYILLKKDTMRGLPVYSITFNPNNLPEHFYEVTVSS